MSKQGLARDAIVIDIYCRISQDYDGTLRSVESQEEDCRDAIEEDHPDWTVGKVHRDHAKSAWNPKVYREEWTALMARLESGEADGVMVYDLTRFTRKPMEGERLLALAQRGVVVASLTTTYNLRTPDGRKQFRDAMTAAAHESDLISQRSSRGKRKKARRGKSNAAYRGFARDGYLPVGPGWEPGDPREVVDRAQLAREQAAVRDAATYLLNGGTLNAVADQWNDAGLFTVHGARWDGAAVRQLLEAPSLAGLITYKGEIVGELSDGEHALDRDTFERLQLHFASRKRGRPASTYLLSAILRCGRCGGKLYGRPRSNGAPYPFDPKFPAADLTRREYWCMPRARDNSGCGRLNIDQRFADAAVKRATLGVLGDPRHADRLARRAVKVEQARGELTRELHRLEEDAEALASKVASWGFARVNAAMEPMEKRMGELREKLAGLEAPDRTATVDAAAAWEDAKTVEEKRAMVRRAFPDGIVVHPAVKRGRAARSDDRFDFNPAAREDTPSTV